MRKSEYLESVAKHEILSASKQNELYAELDKLCPERLVKDKRPCDPPAECIPVVTEIASYLYRLVKSIAEKYRYKCGDLAIDELVQVGYIGLLRGIWRFDNSRGFNVTTYVTYWINQNIGRFISDQSRVIRLPVHVGSALGKINKAINNYQRQNGDHPSVDHISEHTEIKPKKVNEFLKLRYTINTESLDQKIEADDNDDTSLYDFQFVSQNIDQQINEIELGESLDNALAELTAREERILRMRFGLMPYIHPMTLKEIGEKFGLTRERARQIEAEALDKLRELDCVSELEEFITL